MKAFVCESIADFSWQQFLPLLPPERRERALHYRMEADRQLYVASYMLLCRVLKEMYGISGQLRLAYGEQGKPCLLDYPQVFFNMSHCRCGVACAVADSEVGVDIQPIQAYSEAVAKRAFCPNELAQLNAADNKALEFAKLWTRKEAYLKKLGAGISDSMNSVDTTRISALHTFCLKESAVSACGTEAAEIIKFTFGA